MFLAFFSVYFMQILYKICIFAVMKRIFILILLGLTLLNSSGFALPIDSILVKLQVPELSLLSKNNRLDLLDYINCGQVGTVENLYLGKTSITKKTANYLHLEMTSVNSVELIVLPREVGDTIIGILTTIKEPIKESQLRFYSLDCVPLSIDFNFPTIDELVRSEFSSPKKDIFLKLRVTLNYLCEEGILVCQASKNCFTIEEDGVHDLIFKQLRYKWNGHSFVVE